MPFLQHIGLQFAGATLANCFKGLRMTNTDENDIKYHTEFIHGGLGFPDMIEKFVFVKTKDKVTKIESIQKQVCNTYFKYTASNGKRLLLDNVAQYGNDSNHTNLQLSHLIRPVDTHEPNTIDSTSEWYCVAMRKSILALNRLEDPDGPSNIRRWAFETITNGRTEEAKNNARILVSEFETMSDEDIREKYRQIICKFKTIPQSKPKDAQKHGQSIPWCLISDWDKFRMLAMFEARMQAGVPNVRQQNFVSSPKLLHRHLMYHSDATFIGAEQNDFSFEWGLPGKKQMGNISREERAYMMIQDAERQMKFLENFENALRVKATYNIVDMLKDYKVSQDESRCTGNILGYLIGIEALIIKDPSLMSEEVASALAKAAAPMCNEEYPFRLVVAAIPYHFVQEAQTMTLEQIVGLLDDNFEDDDINEPPAKYSRCESFHSRTLS